MVPMPPGKSWTFSLIFHAWKVPNAVGKLSIGLASSGQPNTITMNNNHRHSRLISLVCRRTAHTDSILQCTYYWACVW